MSSLHEIKTENKYMCMDGDNCICLIERIGENLYHFKNSELDAVVEMKPIDEYHTSGHFVEYKQRGKNGRYYKTTKLWKHNLSWCHYMLEEKGFIRKSKCIA